MRLKNKKYKINAEDIGKLYKITKRRVPALPAFEASPKALPETDDDGEVLPTLSL